MKNPIRLQHNKHHYNKLMSGIVLALSLSFPATGFADASSKKNIAPLKPGMPYLFVVHNGRSIKVERDIDNSYRARIDIRGTLIQTADTCPPFCLQPQQLDLPVETVGEAEIIDFMMDKLRSGQGTLVDIRAKVSHDAATIPGSVHYFVQTIQKGLGDAKFEDMLIAFGAKRRTDVSTLDKILESTGIKDSSMLTDSWDFTEAKELIIWTNSALEKASAIAIEELLATGYPAEKLKWYRGGLASWQYWGFNTYNKTR